MSSAPARCHAWHQTPRGACMDAWERQLLPERLLFDRRNG
jgi:hypothetical protein